MGARPCLRRTRVAPESDANGAGLRAFLGDWTAVFGGWELQLDAFHDAGEKVVAVGVQRGRVSASGGPSIEAPFGLVYTLGDGLLLRGEAYADPAEALKAAGLEPWAMSANVDLVRSIFAALEHGDFSSVEWAHPEIEYVQADGPHFGTWIGHMPEGARDWASAWEDLRG